MTTSVRNFSERKIRCDEDVDPAPVGKELGFSDRLSSTPSEEVLLRGVDLSNVAAAGKGGGCEDNAHLLPPIPKEVMSSHQQQHQHHLQGEADEASSKEDDNHTTYSESRKSSGSHSSLQNSPALKRRDSNIKVPVSAGKKPRKHHSHGHGHSHSSIRGSGVGSGSSNTFGKKNKAPLVSTSSVKRKRVSKSKERK